MFMKTKVLFILALMFGTAAYAQPVPNIIEVPTYTYFECENHGQLKVITQVDRGVYAIQYADVLALIRGTFQYTPGTNGGAVFDYPAYVQGRSNQIGNFRFVAPESMVYMDMATWSTRCRMAGTFDITNL